MVRDLPCEVHNAILYGLQKLAVLRLAFAPNERQLPDTAMVWLEMAARKGGWIPDDAARVEHAFVRLAIELDKWPTPHQFFAYLPPRPVLPPPDTPRTAADYAEAARFWGEIAQQLDCPPSKRPPQIIRNVAVRDFAQAGSVTHTILQDWQQGDEHDEEKNRRRQSR